MVLLVAVSLAACPAIPFVLPVALEFARSLFNATAKNYAPGYNEDLMALLQALVRPSGYSTGSAANSPPWPVYGPGPGNQPPVMGGGYPPTANYPPPSSSSPYPGNPYPGGPNSPGTGGSVYPNPPPPVANYPPPQNFPSSPTPYPDSSSSGYPPNSVSPPGAGGGMPSANIPGKSYAQVNPSVPIALDVALLRKTVVNGRTVPVPIQDGDVLKDGRGNPQAGDKFKIVFRPTADCFVYVIAIDGSGWAQGLFPSKNSPSVNPVRKGQEYVLPDGAYWYSLDQFRGIETIYVVAVYQRRADIEEIFVKIAGRERSATAVPEKVEQPPVLPNGFGTTQPGQPAVVQTESGEIPVSATRFFTNQAGEDLRVTRWFRHE